jgi:hypothetical protein
MDKKKIIIWIGIFLVGVVIGGLIVCLMCCNCKNTCMFSCNKKLTLVVPNLPMGVEQISVDTAKKYFNCYLKDTANLVKLNPLWAFRVSKEQLIAMETLMANDTTAKSFRIYMGIYGDPQPVNMIVAVDEAGNDNTQTIYKTAAIGPCPDQCDGSSDIVNSDK